MLLRRFPALALPLFLVACQGPLSATSGAPATAPEAATVVAALAQGGGVTATARLAAVDQQGRSLLAVVVPYGAKDVDHVLVSLHLREGKQPQGEPILTQRLNQNQLKSLISFTNLSPNQAYAITVKAWADAKEEQRIDTLSTEAEANTTAFDTTNDNLVDVGAIRLKLRNKIFSGNTTGSALTITEGALGHEGQVGVVVQSPLEAAQSQVTQLETQTKALGVSLAQSKQAYGENEVAIKAKASEIALLDKELSDLNAKLAQFDTDLSGLQGKLATLTPGSNEHTELQAKISATQQERDGVQGKVVAAQGSLSTAKTAMGLLEAEATALKGKLTEGESALAKAEKDLLAAKEALAKLQGT